MKCVRINPEPFSGTVNERTLGLYSPLCMAKINRNKTRKLFSRKQLRNVLTNCTIFPREIDKLPRKKKEIFSWLGCTGEFPSLTLKTDSTLEYANIP